MSSKFLTRRTLLGGFTGLALASALPGQALATQAPSHRLVMTNIHTGETYAEDILINGKIIAGALEDFRSFARDHRDGTKHEISASTVYTACMVQKFMLTPEPLQLISGYRSPKTNALLRSRSSGVAKHSLHMEGRALDIRQPGRSVSDLQTAAAFLQRGGVGKYSGSNFVHVDDGPVRYWGS